MRRRLMDFVPIVLFAVLVQLMAPIGALLAAAHAVSDPLATPMICSEMMTAEGQTMPSQMPDNHGDCCAFCAIAHSGSVVIDPPPLFVKLQRQYQRVVWLEAIDAVPTVRIGSNTQARAPPIFFPI